jgi:hypothetical protein
MNASGQSQDAMLEALAIKRCQSPPAYSICTMITRPAEYEAMRESFLAHGFASEDTEYLSIDNSHGNRMHAFQAYNAFLTEARAPYIILCHHDVVLLEHGREKLDRLLAELDQVDPFWAVCGNAGVREDGVLAIRITDPHGPNRLRGGPFPALVTSLDENFVVVRRAANLAVSRDLAGFHLCATDLCLVADILGWSAYVIDFHLDHRSGGDFEGSFHQSKSELRRKYQRAFRPRWIQSPGLHPIFISGIPVTFALARVLLKLGFWPRLRINSRK